MLQQWLRTSRVIRVVPLVLALVFVAACGSTAPAEPDVVIKEVEVTKEVEVVKEVIKEVEVEKEVIKEILVTAVPAGTMIPLVVVKGETFEFPLKPAWVNKGKYQNMVLEIAATSNPGTWDMHFTGNLFSGLIPGSPPFNQLVEYNPAAPSEIIGDLAKSWEVNADGTVYKFTIHDAQWSDGQPVTAEDILFSFNRITEPGAIRARTKVLSSFYEHGTGKVLGDKTVEIPLKFPAATFLPNLATDYMKMYAKHNAEGMSQEEANVPGALLGSGPWVIKEFKTQAFTEYVRNPLYFKPDRPFFDGMKINIFGGGNIARAYSSLEVGQVHMTEALSPTWKLEVVFDIQEKTNGRLKALNLADAGENTWFVNIDKPPTDDPRVRRALHIGMDRWEMVDILYCQNEYGKCFGAPGSFIAGSLAGEQVELPELLKDVPGYRLPKEPDLVEARALLAQAGFADGLTLTMNTSSGAQATQIMNILAAQFKENLNVTLKLDAVDTPTMMTRILEGTHHLNFGGSAIIVPDAADLLNQHYLKDISKNPQNWGDPEVDKLITAQEQELDSKKRLVMIRRILEILRQGESHVIPVVNWDAGGLIDYRLQNYIIPGSMQLVYKRDHFWWDPDAACTHPGGCTSN